MNPWLLSLLGGALIGLSVSLMLLWNGRVTGISGILNGALHFKKNDWLWRVLFVAGLIAGGFILKAIWPETIMNQSTRAPIYLAVAGWLVGFGTVMGSGCTSGHGVCGLSRLSIRSFLATLSFMVMGIVMVAAMRKLGVF